jgi:hypothetical protein
MDSEGGKQRRLEETRRRAEQLAVRQKKASANPFEPDTDDEDDPNETSESYAAHDLIDFSPIYRCTHIFMVLVGLNASHAVRLCMCTERTRHI